MARIDDETRHRGAPGGRGGATRRDPRPARAAAPARRGLAARRARRFRWSRGAARLRRRPCSRSGARTRRPCASWRWTRSSWTRRLELAAHRRGRDRGGRAAAGRGRAAARPARAGRQCPAHRIADQRGRRAARRGERRRTRSDCPRRSDNCRAGPARPFGPGRWPTGWPVWRLRRRMLRWSCAGAESRSPSRPSARRRQRRD